MQLSELEAGIAAFCAHLFSPLGVPEVRQQIISTQRLKVRVGVKIDGVPPEVVKEGCVGSAMREAWLHVWPENQHGGCSPKSIMVSGDGGAVIFDLTFFSAKLELPEGLTGAP